MSSWEERLCTTHGQGRGMGKVNEEPSASYLVPIETGKGVEKDPIFRLGDG